MTISPDRPTAAPTPVTRLPDFFIAGQPKSGTTALYEMLKRHPQIYMSPVKEPFYFAADNPLPEGTDGRRWRSLEQTGIRAESLERYASLFAPADFGECGQDQRARAFADRHFAADGAVDASLVVALHQRQCLAYF